MSEFEDPARHSALPPGYEAYVGTDGPLPNAVGAVEHFFGAESFSSELIGAIETLPPEQARKLFFDITVVTDRASNAIGARNSLLDYPNEDTYSVLAVEDLHLLHAPPESMDQPLPELPRLKQAALYCARTIIPDAITPGITKDTPDLGPILAHRFREIEPITGLIQAGVFIPIPELDVNTFRGLSATLMRNDPYIAHLLRENPTVEDNVRSVLEDMAYKAFLQTDPPDPKKPDATMQGVRECAQIISEIYPGFDSGEKLLQTLLYCSQARYGDFAPVTSDRATTHHLLECNAVAFQGGEAAYGRVMQQVSSNEFEPAFKYGVPALSEVSFEELHELRRSETTFARVSDALHNLSNACSDQLQHVESYQDYMELVRQHSEGTVEPVYRELTEWHEKAARRGKIAGVSSELIGLGLDVVSVPGLSKLASVFSRRAMTGKRTAPLRRNAEIGARILRTFL